MQVSLAQFFRGMVTNHGAFTQVNILLYISSRSQMSDFLSI